MTTTSGNNFTTLYSNSASLTQPQLPYGNANVVSLLAAGTDGGNTITNIVATGNITANNFIGNLIGNVTGNINGNVNATNVTITGNLSGNTANFSGNVTAPFFLGNVVGNISGNIVVPGVQGSVLFNDGGNAGADTGFVYDKTLNTLGVLDGVTSNVFTGNLSGTTSTVTGNSNAAIFNGNFNGGNVVATGNVNFTGANVSLGAVGNLHITGGSASQVLTTNGSGGLSWSTPASSGIIVQDEGSTVAATANTMNFTGTGVTASAVGNVVTVNVPGQTTANIIANVNSNVSIPTANGNIVINANAGTNEQWIFDTTGNITTPANSVISSVTNDLTLGANNLFNNLRVGGRADTAAFPGAKQSGWYFNGNYNPPQSITGIFTNTGSTTDSLDVYFVVPLSVTVGNAVVSIDTLGLESLQNGPLTWNSANAALLVGQGTAVFDFDISLVIPQATIFPLGTTIQSVNVGAGTITMSAPALKTSTNFAIDAGTVISSPVDGYYQLVGDDGFGGGSIDYWDQPTAATAAYGLTGYGGPFLATPPAGSALTYTPSKTWSVYPELRTAVTPGTWRAIDQNNVPETIMSYTRYNNPVIIGADASGNAAGFPTYTGRSDTAGSYNGLMLLATGLDTRLNGDVTQGFTNGNPPKMALNFINYETPNGNANVVIKRQARERQGPLVASLSGAGNINTAVANIYVQQYQGLGSVRFNGLGGTTGTSGSQGSLVAGAGMYARAEADFTTTTNNPTGLYFQYTPSNVGTGNARTFLRAEALETTVSGGNVVYIKPVSNYGTGNATVIRNAERELNAVQDTIWLQAAYYNAGGTATTEGVGTLVQARGDRSTGNVALGINRAVGTTGSYELIIKSGESALTLYDKNNTANIATFTNTASTFNGNLTAANIVTNSGNITGNSNIAITGTITGYNKTNGYLNYGTSITGLTANTVNTFTFAVVSANNITVASSNQVTIAKAGTYEFTVTCNVENIDTAAEHDFNVWISKNGTDLTYSNMQTTVVRATVVGGISGKNTVTMTYQDTCAANDYYQIRYAVSDTNVQLPYIAAITSPYVRPSTAPVSLYITPVGA